MGDDLPYIRCAWERTYRTPGMRERGLYTMYVWERTYYTPGVRGKIEIQHVQLVS